MSLRRKRDEGGEKHFPPTPSQKGPSSVSRDGCSPPSAGGSWGSTLQSPAHPPQGPGATGKQVNATQHWVLGLKISNVITNINVASS